MIDALLKNFLFSTRLMAVLFLTFGVAMAVGTFVESWYSTETARIWVYNTWWFEAIMAFFMVNFSGNIFRYRLYRKERWATLLLHLSFIFILVGAFITRYIGYEGMMPIREGATEDFFISQKTYVTVWVDGEIDGRPKRRGLQDEIMVTPEAEKSRLPWNSDFNGTPFTISYAGFIEGAEEGIIPNERGKRYLKIVEAGGGTRHDHYLQEGEVSNIHNILFALNRPTEGAINITVNDQGYSLSSPFEGSFMRMADQLQGGVAKDSLQPLMFRSLYSLADMQFVFPEPLIKGHYGVVEAKTKEENMQNALLLDIQCNGQREEVSLLGGQGFVNNPATVKVGGLDFHLSYGSIRHQLPFSITLNDFIAEKYPGTEKSYSSFMSKITVNDERPFDYDIYMNHVLDHEGYRFFQASFDPDERGTVLSVNKDRLGTWVTYVGYFSLFFALMAILFDRHTRFNDLRKLLDKVKSKKAALSIALLLTTPLLHSQQPIATQEEGKTRTHVEMSASFLDSILSANAVADQHAEKFSRLVIQDIGGRGRMKPASTFSSELLRKLSKKDTYGDLSAEQVLLSITQNPAIWYNVPVIYLKRGNDSLRGVIGIAKDAQYARLVDFFDERLNYKLSPYLEGAYRAQNPNKFQKDFIETDRKVNLLYSALEGKLLKIFPIPDDPGNKWVSHPELSEYHFPPRDSANIKRLLPTYMTLLFEAGETGDYSKADALLKGLQNLQWSYGGQVMPSEDKITAEILYDRYDIFKRLFSWYLFAGLLMLIILIVQIFRDTSLIRWAITILRYVIVLLFVLHLIGLITRWFISGHAPWSDAYESMIYVAWATMFFGLALSIYTWRSTRSLFNSNKAIWLLLPLSPATLLLDTLFTKRRSDMIIAAAAFITSIILMVAHWNWMDPSIANLQPVLDSYWLMIHVAVIVGSYGPFALGMILGVLSLLLMVLTTKANKKKISLNIQELTVITEMSLTVGLVMLTIGNFLGGMWANESWGRYWGWDPKETWALISIMVYAFVIHARLVPGLRGRWTFNFLAVIAFASIMMTYFGVNFYLTGLHSYASGDKVITPNFVFYTLAGVAILGAVSYLQYNKHYRVG